MSFLRRCLRNIPKKGKIVIILDNAKVHHAKLIQLLLEKLKNRLELMFLSPYSPGLNLIEGL
ncbi:transposase [Clostridium beijerinckii]|uniref:transposase n=1 Tax=Clostridium beijerinckii TaxID=1520 RepID=UPI00098CA699